MSRLGFKRPHVYCDNQRKEPAAAPYWHLGTNSTKFDFTGTNKRGEQKYQLKAPAINKRAVIENGFDSNSQVL